jgi:hypothetical protein
MKLTLTLKDYVNEDTILTVPVNLVKIDGRSVYVCDAQKTAFDDEIETAIYAVNNGVHYGVLAENYSQSYEPINPYLVWDLT